jgi:hypothetical protein
MFGWAQYTGLEGCIIGMKTFGASAPLERTSKKIWFRTTPRGTRCQALVGKGLTVFATPRARKRENRPSSQTGKKRRPITPLYYSLQPDGTGVIGKGICVSPERAARPRCRLASPYHLFAEWFTI